MKSSTLPVRLNLDDRSLDTLRRIRIMNTVKTELSRSDLFYEVSLATDAELVEAERTGIWRKRKHLRLI